MNRLQPINELYLTDKEKIDIILRQTNYTEEEATVKLDFFNDDHIKVIKDFLGITEKKTIMKSLNQEIYKNIRLKLDESMIHYNKKLEEKLTKEISQL
jgi:hypothetical protein